MREVHLERQTAKWALLTLGDGRQFDVDGECWSAMKETARDLVAIYAPGAEIVFCSELPE